jgi:pimeloyl-ACP methyl ester carboxylesterase
MSRNRRWSRASGIVLSSLIVLFVSVALSARAQTVRNDHFVESSAEPGAKIYVRERVGTNTDPAQIDKAVLFVHGATYPGVTFDLPIAGYGWMTLAAERGYAAYYLDVRGYGKSTRPPAMDADPKANPPFSRATDAVKDIADAVDFILNRTGAEKINLIGWSWGTVTTGMYTSQNNEKVEKLVLYAPVYAHEVPAWTERLADKNDPTKLGDIGAFRTVNAEQARERWEKQIVPDNKDEWRENAVFEAWFKAMIESEPGDTIRAPNGVLVDVWEIFHARPIYDAAEIKVPTLVIRGSNDPTATRPDGMGLYDKLGSSVKEYTEIGYSTHFAVLERPAPQLMRAVQAFLEQ